MGESYGGARPGLTMRFEEALAFAARLHAGQSRKGTPIPYVSHLLGTAALVLEAGGGEDEAIAALLHDAVEDQGLEATLEEIERRFGAVVARIVEGCTDSWTVPKPPWRERKEALIARLRGATPAVRLVTAADRLHNARAILADLRREGERTWLRFNGGRDGTLWYYRATVDALGGPEPRIPLLDELDRVVTEIENLAGAGG